MDDPPSDTHRPAPVRPPRFDRVAKPDGTWRRLTILERADARRYEAIAARLAPRIERGLSPAVVANRVVGPGAGLEDRHTARRRWRRGLAEPGPWLLLDVRECFTSMTLAGVRAGLDRVGIANDRARPLLRFLAQLAEHGSAGLPVGPEPSAVVANAVLALADDAIAGSGRRHLRWVDDLAIRVRDGRDAVAVIDRVRWALADIGLELNERKTRLVGGSEIVVTARTSSHPIAVG